MKFGSCFPEVSNFEHC